MRSLALIVVFLQCTANGIAAEWTQLSAPKGNFRAEFPTAPKESVQSIQTTFGEIPNVTYMSEVADGKVAYAVSYCEYPEDILQADPEKVLDRGRDGAKENLKGTVVSEISLTFRGHPGREFTVLGEAQGQRLFYHSRVYLVGTRQYILQLMRVGETPVDVADAVRFFSSFEPLEQ